MLTNCVTLNGFQYLSHFFNCLGGPSISIGRKNTRCYENRVQLIQENIHFNMIITKNNKVHGSVASPEWTFTSKFVLFLTKICFIPVTVNFNKDKIHFKIWKAFVYILLVPGTTLFTQHMFMFELIDNDALKNYGSQSLFEGLSNYLFGLCILAGFCIPLFIGYGLQKTRPSEIFKENLFF